ncbi:MAG TPA: exodeoxyribonuclease VII large subunit [Terriglobales bacterium]|nr:exodeoxyribonuclease VII large subunit [Terriglobales bacterium]
MQQLSLSTAARPQPKILSVSELTQRLRAVLDDGFRQVWVAGEISSCRTAPSGHCYFVLKDAQSQIAAVLFRNTLRQVRFRLTNGLAVVIRGRVSLYDAQGSLQLYVDTIEPQGLGALQLALEQLKQKLQAEGLFDESRKRPLPYLPRTIGIVTGRRGAALHDMLVTLRRRAPGTRIIVRPALVQGRDAPPDIVAALDEITRVAAVEVVIVGRGGGSLEDLWAFNDERVARAIAAAPVPVISAVGHEIDFTIADFVADHRAATPTAAATLVVPDRRDLHQQLAALLRSLCACTQRQIQRQGHGLTALRRQLRDPRQTLQQLQVRVDDLGERSVRAMAANLRRARDTLASCAQHLQAISPLACLERGYTIVRKQQDQSVVTRAAQLGLGEPLKLILHEGAAVVRVETIEPPA